MFSAWFTVCCVAKIGPFRNFCETGLSLSWMRVLWWFTTKNKLAKLIKMLTISVWWSCVWVLNHVTDLHCLFFASISRPHFILTLPALSSQHICFLFYSSMLFYSICSLFTFFSSLRTFPSSFPDLLLWSHQGRVSQPPVCPSLDVPPPPPVPPDHAVTPEGPAVPIPPSLSTSFCQAPTPPLPPPPMPPLSLPLKTLPPPPTVLHHLSAPQDPLSRDPSCWWHGDWERTFQRLWCSHPRRRRRNRTHCFPPLRKSKWHMTRAGWHNSCPHCSQANIQPISMMCHLHETFARPLTMIVMSVWA